MQDRTLPPSRLWSQASGSKLIGTWAQRGAPIPWQAKLAKLAKQASSRFGLVPEAEEVKEEEGGEHKVEAQPKTKNMKKERRKKYMYIGDSAAHMAAWELPSSLPPVDAH